MSLMPKADTFNTVSEDWLTKQAAAMMDSTINMFDGIYNPPLADLADMEVPFYKSLSDLDAKIALIPEAPSKKDIFWIDESSMVGDSFWGSAKTINMTVKNDLADYSKIADYSKKLASEYLGTFDIEGEVKATFESLALYDSMVRGRATTPKLAGYGTPVPEVPYKPFSNREKASLKALKQAIFDRVCEGLRTQGRPGAEIGTGHSFAVKVLPMYRAHDGARCGIGFLMRPDRYRSNMEFQQANSTEVMTAIGLKNFIGDHDVESFLNEVQVELHDTFVASPNFAEEFESRADHFAYRHHLNYSYPKAVDKTVYTCTDSGSW